MKPIISLGARAGVLMFNLGTPRFARSDEPARDRPMGRLGEVATFEGPMPTGVTVSRSGRIFVNDPEDSLDSKATPLINQL